ncbi:hypothetical protein IQ266_17345 [filamentous cyanobacterium LEGE 11480]|uniref:Uncharacterized protein n=1 Tax=Romeriopsis navalis LEGE 11480 TaxID=2777977 RepID=A0A928VND5_9CYAN|nr:hypothetical protein [Romeriopsis navalis]MBE9031500.1 hypothetical protein [Romeriopsis navalis LEGE 11480]
MSHPAMWIESVRFASFCACVIGLFVLYNDTSTQQDFGETDWNFMAFGFGYWLLNCVIHAAQQWICPDCGAMWLSLRLTGLFSLLLTFCSVLSLPMNLIAAKNQIEQ